MEKTKIILFALIIFSISVNAFEYSGKNKIIINDNYNNEIIGNSGNYSVNGDFVLTLYPKQYDLNTDVFLNMSTFLVMSITSLILLLAFFKIRQYV